jgi:hypothetical protein
MMPPAPIHNSWRAADFPDSGFLARFAALPPPAALSTRGRQPVSSHFVPVHPAQSRRVIITVGVQRSRAIDSLCARETAEAAEREAARPARRAAQRWEVEGVLDSMVWDETPDDDDRAAALEDELRQRIENLYADPAARTEDRPAGAVMAGLACGLGMSREWGSWARWWPATPRPARPSGTAAEIEAERNRRRDRVVAAMEQTFAEIRDPARIEGLRAGLALRLTEADAIGWLDTETTHVAALRLCRSLGVDPELCSAELDTG